MAPEAQGRLKVGEPVAIIDIGSNSVRLVAYEGLTRSPTQIFNEKVLAGLGREVLSTGLLPEDGVEKALTALKRFRVLVDIMRIKTLRVIATAAARDAKNGEAFLKRCSEIVQTEVELISGKKEATLSALGVGCGIHKAHGLVGDLGGGSLELIDVNGHAVGDGITLPIGVLSLQDRSGGNLKKAQKLVREAIDDLPQFKDSKGKALYAVGGTWRALARLHMKQRGYPLNVMHNYVIPVKDAEEFVSLVERVEAETLDMIESVSPQRRPLLGYGAVVLEELIRKAKPSEVVISTLGVREGLLFDSLNPDQLEQDPLLVAAREFNTLRSRSPQQGEEMIHWTDAFLSSSHLEETADEKRLRHAACLLADIGWRANPDYRGEQSFNIIANASFIGVDHPGRAYLALAVVYRHTGLSDDAVSPRLRELASSRMIDRARILGGAMRLAYLLSAAMPGVLPRTPLLCGQGMLTLTIPKDLSALAGDRVFNRLKQLARIIGRTPEIVVLDN